MFNEWMNEWTKGEGGKVVIYRKWVKWKLGFFGGKDEDWLWLWDLENFLEFFNGS